MVLPIVTGNRQRQGGFAYIALLASLAVLAMVLNSVSINKSHQAKREREAQLFFVGKQFRNALASYYRVSQDETRRYPQTLTELLVDNRGLKPRYHLRNIYIDPMTQSKEWGLVVNTEEQIVGIYSLSNAALLKSNLPDYAILENKGEARYSDLKFIYQPSIEDEFGFSDDEDNTDFDELGFDE